MSKGSGKGKGGGETLSDKVVKLRFDAEQFQAGVKSAVDGLKTLKDGLKSLKGDKHSIGEFDTSSIENYGNLVQGAGQKFSVLREIATGALRAIGADALYYGKQLVNSLTIDQVSAGWDKYALKTESVQRIMSATREQFTDTGKQMEYVESCMDKLNWFTDETSYNFVDMTSNIGKFTANNVKLDDAVTAMEGISNWAATSGANINEAGRAMYNLSQSLAMGSVRLMDWRSIENANMATAEFKKQVLQSAEALKTIKKTGDGTWASLDGKAKITAETFSSTLEKGWFTSDVLIDVLKKYGNTTDYLYGVTTKYDTTVSKLMEDMDKYNKGTLDMDKAAKEYNTTVEDLTETFTQLNSEENAFGLHAFKMAQEAKTFSEAIGATTDAVSTAWMNIFQNLFGNYEDAKVIWTDLANNLWDIFAAGPSALNDLLREANELETSFHSEFLDGWNALWDAIMERVYGFQEAFGDVFNIEAEDIRDIATKFKEIMEGLKLDDKEGYVESLTKSLTVLKETLTTIGKAGKMAFSWFENIFKGLAKGLQIGKTVDGIKDALIKINDVLQSFFEKLTLEGEKAEKFQAAFSNLAGSVYKAAAKIGGALGELYSKLNKDAIVDFTAKLGNAIVNFGEFIAKIIDAVAKMDWLWKFIGSVFKGIGAIVKPIMEGLTNMLDTLLNHFSALDIVMIAVASKGARVGEMFTDLGAGFKAFKGVFGGIKESLEGFADWSADLKRFVDVSFLKSYAQALLMLAGALWILSSIDTVALAKSLAAMTIAMKAFTASAASLSKILTSFSTSAKTKIPIIGDLFDLLRGMFKGLQMAAFTVGLINMGIALIAFATAMKMISGLSWNGIAKGLAGCTAALAEMYLVMLGFSKIMLMKDMEPVKARSATKMASAMIPMAIALIGLAAACKIFGSMDIETLGKGLGAITICLTEIAAILAIFNKMKIGAFKTSGMIAFGLMMIEFGAVLAIMTGVVGALGRMDTKQLIKGILALSAMITILLVVVKKLDSLGLMATIDMVGFVELALGLVEVAGALWIVAQCDWVSLAVAVPAIGITLGLLVAALAWMRDEEIKINNVADLVIACLALIEVATALQIVAQCDWASLGIAVAALGVAMAELIGVMYIMSKVKDMGNGVLGFAVMAGSLILLASALKILSTIDGAGVASALTVLAGSLAVLTIALAGFSLCASFLAPGIAILAVLAGILVAVGIAFLEFGAGLEMAVEAMAMLNAMSLDAEVLKKNLDALGTSIVESNFLKDILLSLSTAIVSFLTELISEIPGLVKDLGEALVQAMAQLIQYVPMISVQLLVMIEEAIRATAKQLPSLGGAFGELLKGLFEGFKAATGTLSGEEMLQLVASIRGIQQIAMQLSAMAFTLPVAIAGAAELVEVASILGRCLEAFSDAINKAKDFDADKVVKASEAIKKISEAGKNMAKVKDSKLDDFSNNIKHIGRALANFSDSVKGIDEASVTTAVEAFSKITTISNKIPKTAGIFSSGIDLKGFAKSLSDFGRGLSNFMSSISTVSFDNAEPALNSLGKIVELSNKIPKNGSTIVKWWGGEKDLGQFGRNMTELGKGISNLTTYANASDYTNFDKAIDSVQKLCGINVGNLPDFFFNDYDVTNLTESMEAIFDALQDISPKTKDIDVAAITKYVDAVKQIERISDLDLPDISYSNGSLWIQSFKESVDNIKQAAEASEDFKKIKTDGLKNLGKVTEALSEIDLKMDGFPRFDVMRERYSWDDWVEGFTQIKDSVVKVMKVAEFHSREEGEITDIESKLTGLKNLMTAMETIASVGDIFTGDTAHFPHFESLPIPWDEWGKAFGQIRVALATALDDANHGAFGKDIDTSGIINMVKALEELGKLNIDTGGLVKKGSFPRFDKLDEEINFDDWGKGFKKCKEAVRSALVSSESARNGLGDDVSTEGVAKLVDTIQQLSTIQLDGDIDFPRFDKMKIKWNDWIGNFQEAKTNISTAAHNLKSFENLDLTPLQNFAQAIDTLTSMDLANNDGAELPDFSASGMGIKDWGEWSKGLEDCAKALNLGSIKVDATPVENLADAISSLKGIKPEDIPDFSKSEGLKSLKLSLSKINNALTTVDGKSWDIAGFQTAVVQLVASLESIPPDSDKLATFGANVEKLAASLGNINGQTFDTSGITSALSTMAQSIAANSADMDAAGQSLGQALDTGVSTGITANVGNVLTAVAQMLNAAKNAGAAVSVQWANVGKQMCQGLINGLNSMKALVVAKANEIAKAATAGLKAGAVVKSPSRAWMQVGNYMDQGLIIGMDKGKGKVKSSAAGVANAATDAARDALGVHSPSLVWQAIGRYCTEGLALGIKDGIDTVISATKSMSDMVTEIMSKSTFEDLEDTMSHYENLGLLAVETKTEIYRRLSELDEATAIKMLGDSNSNDKAKDAKKKIKEYGEQYFSIMKEAFDKMIDDAENYGLKTPEEIMNIFWGKLSNLEEGSQEYIDTLRACDERLWSYDEARIERAKEYGLMTIEQEIEYWSGRLERYQAGSTKYNEVIDKLFGLEAEQRQQEADREMLLNDKMIDNEYNFWVERIKTMDKGSQAYLDAYQRIRDEIANLDSDHESRTEEDNSYGKLGKTQQLNDLYLRLNNAIKRVKKAGQDVAKDPTVKKLRKDIYDLTMDINDARKEHEANLKQLKDDYKEACKSIKSDYYDNLFQYENNLYAKISEDQKNMLEKLRQSANSFRDYFGIFGEVMDDWDDIDLADMYFNINDQIEVLTHYSDMMDSVAKKVSNKQMLEEIRNMGMDGYSYVEAIYNASTDQVRELEQAWAKRDKITQGLAYKGDVANELDEAQKINMKNQKELAKEYARNVKEEMDAYNKSMFVDADDWGKTAGLAFYHVANDVLEQFGFPGFGYNNDEEVWYKQFSGDIYTSAESMHYDIERLLEDSLLSPAFQDILTNLIRYMAETNILSLSSAEDIASKLEWLESMGYTDTSRIHTVADVNNLTSGLKDILPEIDGAKIVADYSGPIQVDPSTMFGDVIENAIVGAMENGGMSTQINGLVDGVLDLKDVWKGVGFYVDSNQLVAYLSDEISRQLGRFAYRESSTISMGTNARSYIE